MVEARCCELFCWTLNVVCSDAKYGSAPLSEW
jgi:hypothetical protein